jgi:6-pyruvoyltetrahydropterin/6-carboxytetrahydropterin synthase
MLLTKIFTFDAAHALTQYYGQCEKLHGHTFTLHVTVEGPVGENGLVLDFTLLKRIVKVRVLEKLDHRNLNDSFKNPSSELVAQWIWQQLVDLSALLQEEIQNPALLEDLRKYGTDPEKALQALPSVEQLQQIKLYEIKLFESATSCVAYRGE